MQKNFTLSVLNIIQPKFIAPHTQCVRCFFICITCYTCINKYGRYMQWKQLKLENKEMGLSF